MPTLASLRQLISNAFRSDVDFDSFCLDHFEDVYRRFTKGMEYPQKINILLERIDRRIVLERLCGQFPQRSTQEDWHNAVEWEYSKRPASKSKSGYRWKRIRDMILGSVLGDWLRRIWRDLTPEMRLAAMITVLLFVLGYGVNYIAFPNLGGVRRGQVNRYVPKIPVAPPNIDIPIHGPLDSDKIPIPSPISAEPSTSSGAEIRR